MRRILLTAILGIAFMQIGFSQGPPRYADKEGRNERVKAMRIAFITDKLALTPDESAKFWPIFNEMEAKGKELRRNFRKDNASPQSEEEAKQALMNLLALEEEQIRLKKEYFEKLHSAISYSKLYKLKEADKEFKQELLKRSRDRRRGE